MSNSILNPHDRLFRTMMTKPKITLEFFEQHLPDKIKAVINFETIQLQKESYIDDKLRLQITDILYSVEFSGKPGYLYLLVEHQSTPFKLMAFRVLRYMIAIMEHHLMQIKSSELPVIYPMVFYSGNQSYSYSTDLFDLFGDNKELAKNILLQPYQLVELSKISDNKLKEFLEYGVVARTMKHIYEKNFLPVLRGLIGDLKVIEGLGDMDYIYKLLSYIIEAGELDKQEFINTIKTGLTQVDEVNIMTLAEQFRQEGYERAKAALAEQFIKEGYQKGAALAEQKKQEGKQEALTAIAMKLFAQNMAVSQVANITGLSVWEVEKLKGK